MRVVHRARSITRLARLRAATSNLQQKRSPACAPLIPLVPAGTALLQLTSVRAGATSGCWVVLAVDLAPHQRGFRQASVRYARDDDGRPRNQATVNLATDLCKQRN